MFIYTFAYTHRGLWANFFIGHRILFNAVKYANSLISFVVVWWEIVTFQVDFFFFLSELKFETLTTLSTLLSLSLGLFDPSSPFFLLLCVWGALHLVALLAGWWQVSVSVRAGAVSWKGQLHIILHQWNDSSPGSGDSIYFFPSSVMGERHLLRWSPQRRNTVGYWGSQALPTNCRPFVVLYFCFLNKSIV